MPARINQGQKHCGVMLSGFRIQDQMRHREDRVSHRAKRFTGCGSRARFIEGLPTAELNPGGGELIITRCSSGQP